jgi:hypothetical protein
MLAQFPGGVGRGDISVEISAAPPDLNIIQVAGSNLADGFYSSFSNVSGAFSAINGRNQEGKTIVITILSSSTSEAGTNSLNEGEWTSLRIYPTAAGLTVSGTVSGPHINVNGADNVTIDGRMNASGAEKNLTISKIQFINATENDIIKYCTVTGDIYVSGTSMVTADGEMIVGGNLTIEDGSHLSASASTLTVSGNINIIP